MRFRTHGSTVSERAPTWGPWEVRVGQRFAHVICAYEGGRVVIADCAFPVRGDDGGLGAALTKAVLTWGNGRDKVPATTESGPRAAVTAGGPDETCKEVAP